MRDRCYGESVQIVAAATLVLPLLSPAEGVTQAEPVGASADAGSPLDPGRRDRGGGIAAMTLGAVGLAANTGVAIHYGLRARDGRRRIEEQSRELDGVECIPGHCPDANWSQVKSDRRSAALAAGVGGSLSVAALVVGAIVYRRGLRKTEAWEREHSIAVSPTTTGFVVSGRF